MTVSPRERQYILGQVTRLGAEQLNRLWAQASALTDLDFASFVTQAFPELVDPFAAMAGDLAATWYDESPSTTEYTAVSGPLPVAEQLTASATWALGADGTKALDRLQGTLQRAINDSARDTIVLNTEFEPGARWARHASANACAFCKLMATRGASYRTQADALTVRGRSVDLSLGDRRNRASGNGTTDELLARRMGQTTYVRGSKKGQAKGRRTRGSRSIGDKYHDHCVPAGTLVSGPSTEAAYRRLYQGEVVVIATASGQNLTITPNHPVLTDKGWVPAGLLDEGDYVVRSLVGDAGAAAVPHEHQRPALIEDVWSALAVNGLAGVPGSSEDFHGDGADGEVEIVWADCGLDRRFDAALDEQALKGLLTASLWCSPRPGLPIESELAALLPRSGGTSDGVMGSASQRLALVGACARHADLMGLGSAAGSDAHFNEAASYHNARGAKSLGAFQFRDLLVDVERLEEFGVDGHARGARFDPAGFEFSKQGRGVYASLGLDLLARLAGNVELDRIVEYRRVGFSGHVYNLQTENGWYAADSVIVSNCHCVAVEVRPGSTYEPPPYVEKWTDAYNRAASESRTKGEYGAIDLKAVLSKMRSEFDSH